MVAEPSRLCSAEISGGMPLPLWHSRHQWSDVRFELVIEFREFRDGAPKRFRAPDAGRGSKVRDKAERGRAEVITAGATNTAGIGGAQERFIPPA